MNFYFVEAVESSGLMSQLARMQTLHGCSSFYKVYYLVNEER